MSGAAAGTDSALAGAAILAAAVPASAGPVARSESEYSGLGAVFPDPLADCQQRCDPKSRGRVGAKSFIGYGEFVAALRFMNQKTDWQRYVEVWPLDGKLGVGAGNGGPSDVPGNNLGRLEFDPRPEYVSAGLARSDLTRLHSDLITVRVTDEAVPDTFKKRYALSLSIHGIERAGAEGGIRAMEDLVTAATTKRLGEAVVSPAVKAGGPTFLDVLQNSIIYFTFPNPDGWRRGSISMDDGKDSNVFFQRYNGNGVDPNRDWPDIGFSFRFYSGLSEPETRAFSNFFGEVRKNAGPFAAGDDLHGQPEADALSYTLMPHGRHDFAKDVRIREASKRINRAQYEATKWSPIIQDNDKPPGGGTPCVPGALGDVCAKIYAQTWGSVYDTINYTTTGALGDWFDSAVGLNADGIDNEMSFSHLDKNTTFEPQTEQLHVAGNKAIIYSHAMELLDPPMSSFDALGTKAFVPNRRLQREERDNQPGAPPGTVAQAPLESGALPTSTFNFAVKQGLQDGKDDTSADKGKDIFNGGMRVEARQPNLSGIQPGGNINAVLRVQCQGCDRHRDNGKDNNEEWVTVAEDYNQSFIYQQAGLVATVNHPQGGTTVKWRAVVTGGTSPSRFKVTFLQGPASTGGNTGGDLPAKELAYNVANTDFMRDLNTYVPDPNRGFGEIDPAKVLSGEQSLAGIHNLVLADDPLPGFTGLYGPAGTTPASFDLQASPTVSGAYSPTLVDDPSTRRPGTYVRKDFEIKSSESAGGLHARIEWESAEMDFDLYIYRVIGDKRILVGSAAAGGTTFEDIDLSTPLRAGKYELYVDNWAAPDFRFTGKVDFKPVDPNPPTGDFTVEQRDAWFAKLKEYVEGGGNLILTDGALRALPGLTGIPTAAVGPSTVYAGQLSFDIGGGKDTLKDPLLTAPQTISQPAARFNSGLRRQTFEPTPLGFAIQSLDRSGRDKSFARQWDIDRSAFEAIPNSRVVAVSADPGARDAARVQELVAMGEVKQGNGQIRFVGALLPQPTEAFDHELGLEPYAVTYTGYIIFRNLFATAEEQAAGTVAGVTYSLAGNSKRKPRFLISRRLTRMNLKGFVPVRVSCRAAGGCKGTLLLERRVRVKVRGKRKPVLRTRVFATKTFNIRGKRRVILRVKLRRGARKSVRSRPRTLVRAGAAVAYAEGSRESVGPVRFRITRPKG